MLAGIAGSKPEKDGVGRCKAPGTPIGGRIAGITEMAAAASSVPGYHIQFDIVGISMPAFASTGGDQCGRRDNSAKSTQLADLPRINPRRSPYGHGSLLRTPFREAIFTNVLICTGQKLAPIDGAEWVGNIRGGAKPAVRVD